MEFLLDTYHVCIIIVTLLTVLLRQVIITKGKDVALCDEPLMTSTNPDHTN